MDFSNRLKEIRTDKGFTQNQMAQLLGVSKSCYAGYEQGYREPDFKTLIKLCNILEVSSDFLLGL